MQHNTSYVKKISLGILLLVILTVVYLILSPYWTMSQIKRAVAAQDSDTLSRYIDYPAVRQSLKQQLEIAVAAEVRKIGDDHPFALLGAKFVNQVLETGVDHLVQPQHLGLLLRGQALEMPHLSIHTPAKTPVETHYQLKYQDWSRVQINVLEAKTTKQQLNLQRQGWGWKIVALQLPKTG